MDFTFDEDQLLFQTTVRDFLAKECTPEHVRAQWDAGRAHDPALWKKLAEMGVPGLLVDEAHDGLGMDETTAVLVFEELGRAALPEPAIATAAVAAPLLAAAGSGAATRWLAPIARGEAVVAVGHAASPFVTDADVATLLLLRSGDAVHALRPDDITATEEPGNDPSRRLFSVAFEASDATRLAEGRSGRALQTAALDRGALAAAAEQLGVADQLISMAAAYAEERKQFGKPIGSFQAVKHMLADCKVSLEYARPVVHRAAFSVASDSAHRSRDVSMAKVAASDAATHAARTALQVHGALGYTWEQDLHLWMRRAWSLEQAYGRSTFHRRRVEDAVLQSAAPLGAGTTFADAEPL